MDVANMWNRDPQSEDHQMVENPIILIPQTTQYSIEMEVQVPL